MSDPNRSTARDKIKKRAESRKSNPRISPQNPNPVDTTAPSPANVPVSPADLNIDDLLNEPLVDQSVDNLDDIFTFNQSQAQPSTSQNASLGGSFPPQQQSSSSSAAAWTPPAVSRHTRAAAQHSVKRAAPALVDGIDSSTQSAKKKTRAMAVLGSNPVASHAPAGLPSSRARTTVEQVYSLEEARSSPAPLQAPVPALPFLLPTRLRPSATVSRNPESTSTTPIFNPGPSSFSSLRARSPRHDYLNEPIVPANEIVSSNRSSLSSESEESLECDVAELNAMLEGHLLSNAVASTPSQAPGFVAAAPIGAQNRDATEDSVDDDMPYYKFCQICLYKKFKLTMMYISHNILNVNIHSAGHQTPLTCHFKIGQDQICREQFASYNQAKLHFRRMHADQHQNKLVTALNLKPFMNLIGELIHEIDHTRMEALAKGVRPPELLQNRNSRLLQEAVEKGVQFDPEEYKPVPDPLIDAYYFFMERNYDKEGLEALLVQPVPQHVEIDLPDHFAIETINSNGGPTTYSCVNSQTGEHLCLVCWFHDNIIFTANTEEELTTHFLDITHYVGVIRCENENKWRAGYIPKRTCDDYPIDFTTRAQWAAHEQVAEHKEHSPIPSYSVLVAICMEEWKQARRLPQETVDGRAAALGVSATQYEALVKCFLFRLTKPPGARDNRPKEAVDCPNKHVTLAKEKQAVDHQQAILDNIAGVGNVAPVVNPDLVIAGEDQPQAEGPVFVGPTRPDQVITPDQLTTKLTALRTKRIEGHVTVQALVDKEMSKAAEKRTDEDTIRIARFKVYLSLCQFYRSDILVHLAMKYEHDSIDVYRQMLIQAHNGLVGAFEEISVYVKTQTDYEMNEFIRLLQRLETFPSNASKVPPEQHGLQYMYQLMQDYLDLAEAITNREINNQTTSAAAFDAAGNVLRALKPRMDSELLVFRENFRNKSGNQRVSTRERGRVITAVDSWLKAYGIALAKLR